MWRKCSCIIKQKGSWTSERARSSTKESENESRLRRRERNWREGKKGKSKCARLAYTADCFYVTSIQKRRLNNEQSQCIRAPWIAFFSPSAKNRSAKKVFSARKRPIHALTYFTYFQRKFRFGIRLCCTFFRARLLNFSTLNSVRKRFSLSGSIPTRKSKRNSFFFGSFRALIKTRWACTFAGGLPPVVRVGLWIKCIQPLNFNYARNGLH